MHIACYIVAIECLDVGCTRSILRECNQVLINKSLSTWRFMSNRSTKNEHSIYYVDACDDDHKLRQPLQSLELLFRVNNYLRKTNAATFCVPGIGILLHWVTFPYPI